MVGMTAGIIVMRSFRHVHIDSDYRTNVAENVTSSIKGEGIAGWVAQTGVPVLVRDIESDRRFHRSNRPQYESNSLMSVPLKVGERVIGALNDSDRLTFTLARRSVLDECIGAFVTGFVGRPAVLLSPLPVRVEIDRVLCRDLNGFTRVEGWKLPDGIPGGRIENHHISVPIQVE